MDPIASVSVEHGVLFYIVVFATIGAVIAFAYALVAWVKERRKPE